MDSIFLNRFKVTIKQDKFLYAIFSPVISLRQWILIRRGKALRDKYKNLLSKVCYGTIVLHLEEFGGDFEVDARSNLVWRLFNDGQYENEILKVAESHISPEKDIIDIGANVGFYTIFFAKHLKGMKVLAIEPTNHAFELLTSNISRNNVADKVILYKGIATNQICERKITTIPGMEEFSTVGNKISSSAALKGPTQTYSVQGTTIKNLVETYNLNPGFIKMDIEGSEFEALDGAADVLRNFRPLILSELNDSYLSNFGHSSRDVTDLLQSLDYKVFDIKTMKEPMFPFIGEILALPA